MLVSKGLIKDLDNCRLSGEIDNCGLSFKINSYELPEGVLKQVLGFNSYGFRIKFHYWIFHCGIMYCNFLAGLNGMEIVIWICYACPRHECKDRTPNRTGMYP